MGATTTRHGHCRFDRETRTYRSWSAMMQRAHYGNGKDARRYLDKGIAVCARWTMFDNFLGDMGERPEGTTIDRIDGRMGYEPSNCRWATPREQALNRTNSAMLTALGRTQNMSEWARETGFSQALILYRVKRGWTPEDAVTIKPNKHNTCIHGRSRNG